MIRCFRIAKFDNQYNGSSFDPNLPTGESFSNNNVSYPNFTLGLNFRTKIKEKTTLDIGGSTSNLHQPNQNFLYFTSSKLPSRHSAYAKAKVGIKDNWNVQPGVFFQNQKKANQLLLVNAIEVRFSEKKILVLVLVQVTVPLETMLLLPIYLSYTKH
ncbi:MAG: type IX secretion system membrane protein PorP/SprF [Bacteroidetes bacterium]|nr:type IX secretion system membrane protein PorP/SprF [Bacteroidota bacterium]